MCTETFGGIYWNIWFLHDPSDCRIYRVLLELQGVLKISTVDFSIAGRGERRRRISTVDFRRGKKEKEEVFLQELEHGLGKCLQKVIKIHKVNPKHSQTSSIFQGSLRNMVRNECIHYWCACSKRRNSLGEQQIPENSHSHHCSRWQFIHWEKPGYWTELEQLKSPPMEQVSVFPELLFWFLATVKAVEATDTFKWRLWLFKYLLSLPKWN